MAKQQAKKKAAAKPKKPKTYYLVTAPVVITVDEAVGEEELMEVIRARSEEMDIPEQAVVKSGLFRVFEKEVELSTQEATFGLKT